MIQNDLVRIGEKIYRFRKATGLTQAEFAEKAGLSGRTYADIERGCTNMKISTFIKICEVLKVTPNDILIEDSPEDIKRNEEELINLIKNSDGYDKRIAMDLVRQVLR